MSVLSHQSILKAIRGAVPMIRVHGDEEVLVQSAGMDCPLGFMAYRMKAAATPRKEETVEDLISTFSRYHFGLKESGTFLEQGATYVVPLNVDLTLSPRLYAHFSTKSSVGRNDVFVRVLADKHARYDTTPRGYNGRLYLEVTPLSIPIVVAPGISLAQMRIKNAEEHLTTGELEDLHVQCGIIRNAAGDPMPLRDCVIRQDGVFLHADLSMPLVGLEARPNPMEHIDLGKHGYDPRDFWVPVGSGGGTCILAPGRFYLIRTKERVLVPPECCAWIEPYDVGSGEFRSHYAGFFDNGFGGEQGTHGVLEVRVRDVPFRVVDGQPVCRMVFERTDEVPEKLYGKAFGSSYTSPGPSLAKYFCDRYEAWNAEFWHR